MHSAFRSRKPAARRDGRRETLTSRSRHLPRQPRPLACAVISADFWRARAGDPTKQKHRDGPVRACAGPSTGIRHRQRQKFRIDLRPRANRMAGRSAAKAAADVPAACCHCAAMTGARSGPGLAANRAGQHCRNLAALRRLAVATPEQTPFWSHGMTPSSAVCPL